ncbi:MAG: hypothetical protein JO089_06725, partial [Alphaproteobacteria bacterium]|nr:hypothetical protein [Alphaproteobacteria bacterium]
DTGLTLGSTILMASTLAAGAVCTWLAQGEFTELKCIQDERLAHKQAECLMNRQPHEVTAPAPACVIERQKPVQKAALPDTPSPEVMVHDMASRAVACAAQQP